MLFRSRAPVNSQSNPKLQDCIREVSDMVDMAAFRHFRKEGFEHQMAQLGQSWWPLSLLDLRVWALPALSKQVLLYLERPFSAIEQGRRGAVPRAVPRAMRVCPHCPGHSLGNERHLVFECPAFEHIRQQYAHIFQDAFQFHHEDRKSTRLNSSHSGESRMPSSA